jgi:hypothetical protein
VIDPVGGNLAMRTADHAAMPVALEHLDADPPPRHAVIPELDHESARFTGAVPDVSRRENLAP